MTRFTWLLGVMGLVACGDKDDAGDGTGSDTDTNTDVGGGECTNVFSESFPADGTGDAYYRTSVEFTLLQAESDATVTVTGPSGDVAGSTTVDGTVVHWTPNAPLEASTTYDATLSWSCDPLTVTFTTSDVGAPVTSSDLAGNVYSLPLTEGRFVEPPGIGELIGGLLTVSVLIEVTSATEADLTMMGALAVDGQPEVQDLCTETIDFPEVADFTENPYFSVGPDDTVISVAGFEVAIDDLAISGAFSSDGSRIDGAAFSGSIDTRPLVPLVAEGQGDDGVCNLVAGFGITCIPCADGTGDYCLALEVQDMTADQAVGVDLVPVSADDVAANSDCPVSSTP